MQARAYASWAIMPPIPAYPISWRTWRLGGLNSFLQVHEFMRTDVVHALIYAPEPVINRNKRCCWFAARNAGRVQK